MARPNGRGRGELYRKLSNSGLSAKQIAEHAGVNVASVYVWAHRNGVALAKPNANAQRNQKMVHMHAQGCTLQSIGNQFGITRERVRQILFAQGVSAADGGVSLRASISRSTQEANRQATRDAKSIQKYGLPCLAMDEHRASGALNAFTRQRLNAAQRAIHWGLSFVQWWSVWAASGNFESRGRGAGKYVMARIRDEGGYEMGNVHIISSVENSREAVEKWRGKTKVNRGVYNAYPGRAHPWKAKYGKSVIGYFATEEEASAARAAFINARNAESVAAHA